VSDAAYLTAKRTVDDRALDGRVLERFAEELAAREPPVRIVEVGAGTGTMVARLAARGLLPERVTYRAVDRAGTHVKRARQTVPEWLADAGYGTTVDGETVRATGDDLDLTLSLEVADAFEVEDGADALVAGAFLDLVSLPEDLRRLAALTDGGGLLYAPITYDGATGFAPTEPLDGTVQRLYHRHMRTVRDEAGGPRAGRELLEAVPAVGGTVLEAGGADWLIRPDGESYPANEGLVVDHLLETVVEAVTAVPGGTVAPSRLDGWVGTRRAQLAAAELTYLAHNLDVLARLPAMDAGPA